MGSSESRQQPEEDYKSDAEVYIWNARGSNVGHVSLLLDSGKYISYWPKGDVNFANAALKVEGVSHEFDEDVKEEDNRQPDRTIKVKTYLNDSAIEAWWEQKQSKGSYSLLFKNCSDAVWEALKVGNPEKFNDLNFRIEDLLHETSNAARIFKALGEFRSGIVGAMAKRN